MIYKNGNEIIFHLFSYFFFYLPILYCCTILYFIVNIWLFFESVVTIVTPRNASYVTYCIGMSYISRIKYLLTYMILSKLDNFIGDY